MYTVKLAPKIEPDPDKNNSRLNSGIFFYHDVTYKGKKVPLRRGGANPRRGVETIKKNGFPPYLARKRFNQKNSRR